MSEPRTKTNLLKETEATYSVVYSLQIQINICDSLIILENVCSRKEENYLVTCEVRILKTLSVSDSQLSC